jgi:D-alanyl-D-alanine carboxypeptidase (penicillin-binding protein 5/6)
MQRRGAAGLARAAILLLFAAPGGSVAAPAADATVPFDRFPGVAAAYAVDIDGRLTWTAHPDLPRPPASLAKLLTALALLGEGWDGHAQVTVSARAAGIEGSRVGLRAGERVAADDLLTAMLVRSGNDACTALVEHASGSLASFLPRLAAEARRRGLSASRFDHPCGLDAPATRTTARDLLRLAEAALAEPRIALRGRAVEATIRTAGGRELRFRNSNALIGRDPDAVGLKSGYTQQAGRCLIAVAERDGHRVILVMLDATERWWVASNLLVQGLATAHAR